MKIKKDRLIQIIKEEIALNELDDETRELYGRDRETAGDILKSQDAIKNLKTSILKLKSLISGEEAIAGHVGYSAENEPSYSGVEEEIANMEKEILELESNIQIDMQDLQSRER